jgi:hypothetical protein
MKATLACRERVRTAFARQEPGRVALNLFPAHPLQDRSRTENVLTMHEIARRDGRYA